jgi:cysteine desulfurase
MISENYFDYAAATPLDPSVLRVMVPYFGEKFYNPSANYLKSRDIAKDLKNARASIASNLGCKPNEVYFVAGGTEANNLAVSGIMSNFTDKNLLISSIEHESINAISSKFNKKIVKVSEDGHIDLSDLTSKINEDTVVISIILVNNEIGTLQPLKKVAEKVKEIREKRLNSGNDLPLYLHSDASQAGNYFSLNVNSLGVDLMTINGGKIYGPKQSGILFVRTGVKISPIIFGGGQEKGMRSGTENVAHSVGLARAIEVCQKKHRTEQKRVGGLQEVFIKELGSSFKELIINGTNPKSVNIINFSLPGVDNEELMMKLDELGFEVAVGSACKASSDEPSHVLKAIGLSEDNAESTIRVSMGRFTTKESVINLAQAIKKSCQ